MTNVIIGGTATGATALPVANSIDGSNDLLAIYTASSNATQAISRNTLLGVTGSPMDISSTQSVSNKTLGNTNVIAVKDSSLSIENATDTTKIVKFSAASLTTGTTRTFTLPDYNATIATVAGTETLTNKTLTSPTINSPTITNATITADTIAGYTTSNTGSMYGISVTTGAISSALSLTSTLSVTGATTLSSTLSVTGAVTTVGQLRVQSTTAPPAAGASTSGITFSSTANLGLFWGSGAPTFSAAQGSAYIRTDGSSTSTRMYINTTGSTTWTNVTTAA